MSPTRRGRGRGGRSQSHGSRVDPIASTSRGGNAQQSSGSGTSASSSSADPDAPPFEMPGYTWDPFLKRFFKKNQAAEAASALTNPDTRPNRYSRVEGPPPTVGVRNAPTVDGGTGAAQDGDGEVARSQLPANIGRWAGGSGSHFQALQTMRTSGGQHRGRLAQFNRSTSEQFANKLRSSAVYYFTYLNNSWGTPHMHCMCSAPDGIYWAGFSNNVLLATFRTHPVPQRRVVKGDVYGPPSSSSLEDWKGQVKCLPYDRPTDTLKSVIDEPLAWATNDTTEDFGLTYVKDVDRIDLVQGKLSVTLAPTRIILESDHRSVVEPSTSEVRRWKPSINKIAYDSPRADMRSSSIRTVPWLESAVDGDSRIVRAFACGNFIQVILSHPDINSLATFDEEFIAVQTLDALLPPPFIMPPEAPFQPIRWLIDLPALVTGSDPMAIEISPDCQWVVAGLRNGAVLLWDLKNMIIDWQDQRIMAEHPILDASIAGNASSLYIAREGMVPRPPGLIPTEVMATGPGRVHHIAMASDSEFLVMFSSGEILMFRFGSLNEGAIRSFTSHPASDEPLGFAVHHKRRIFAAAGSDGRVRQWSLDESRPIEPVEDGSVAGQRRRISSREEMSRYGSSFWKNSSTGEAIADGEDGLSDMDETMEAWWTDSSTITVVEGNDTFVAGKAVHQVVFPSPPRTLAWVHRPVRDEFAPTTEEIGWKDLNDARIDEPEVPALAVGCHNVLWFFT
ncbi:hypothetical protein A4X09_0g3196 [Tilletia walkeri]|uniref:WD40 repeat-like protein n=1 Tax=Tilletia walkeri TaxID=117179 RepID=A0A8X7T6C8_9BASI|nr:hypothetical protein A4X09_0g3196 [Tilletia walkeri]